MNNYNTETDFVAMEKHEYSVTVMIIVYLFTQMNFCALNRALSGRNMIL